MKPHATRSSVFGLATLSLVLAAGCGSSTTGSTGESAPSGAPAGFKEGQLPDKVLSNLPLVAPKSDLDVPLFSDIVQVDPGADVTFCTFTNFIVDEATIFGESFGAQSPQGHHGIFQYTTTVQDPHTGPCGAMDGNMLLGGTGGKQVADKPLLPTNFGVEVPAGAQLVINHHWINTSDEAVDGQTMMLARRLPRGGDTVLAGNLPMLGLGWEIPASGALTYSTECTFGEDVPYVLALGHMHEFGKHVNIEVSHADGSAADMLIDKEWTVDSGTTASGATIFSLEDPYVIHKGDTVRLTCNWLNSTPDAVGFPREMCIFFGYTIGANYFCANGSFISADQVPAAAKGDIISHL